MMQDIDRKPIDRWLPWLFVLFFVIVFAVNGVMVYVAARSWTGIETRQPYIKGRDYNRTLEEVAKQKALGWTGAFAAHPDAQGSVRLDLDLTDARGKAVGGAQVTARFVRPTHEGHDFRITLEDRGGGRYSGVTHAPLPGQWDVRIQAEHPAGAYRLTHRIVVP